MATAAKKYPRSPMNGRSGRWGGHVSTVARVGIMFHYDNSSSDKGAVGWFGDKNCTVSYRALFLDDGSVKEDAPEDVRSYHAGNCRPPVGGRAYSDANKAWIGLAAALKTGEKATEAQLDSMALYAAEIFRRHPHWKIVGAAKWTPTAVRSRITGHDREAWVRNRRIDPSGFSVWKDSALMTDQAISGKHPIISLTDMAARICRYLNSNG